MNSLYKTAPGFSFGLMKPIVIRFAVAIFSLFAFSCSTDTQTPQGSDGNQSGATPKGSSVDPAPPPTNYVLNPPVFEGNYTGEALSASGVVSIDQSTWEEIIEVDAENRSFDSRTGNFLEGTVKVYDGNGQLSGMYNYKKNEGKFYK